MDIYYILYCLRLLEYHDYIYLRFEAHPEYRAEFFVKNVVWFWLPLWARKLGVYIMHSYAVKMQGMCICCGQSLATTTLPDGRYVCGFCDTDI